MDKMAMLQLQSLMLQPVMMKQPLMTRRVQGRLFKSIIAFLKELSQYDVCVSSVWLCALYMYICNIVIL